jgi:ketosteroid isomerase-like protein
MQLLLRSFEALSRGDFTVLEDSLAADAKWRTVAEGPTNCEGRATIIKIISRNLGARLRGSIEEMVQTGNRVRVAFRPERPSEAGDRPLDDGIAYMVVTVSDGRISELKGCADRAAATAYARSGDTLDA